jgi:predicted dehydrogenase
LKNKSQQIVRALVVGGSGHSVWVFDEWAADDAPVELVGAVKVLPDEDLTLPLGHPWAKRFNVNIYNNHDLSQALTAEHPDIVIISTRPDLNANLIETCLRFGCHVITEKPVATTKKDLLRINTVVKKTGKYVLPMLGMHKFPQLVAARTMVRNGLIGKPALVNARKSYQWGSRADWYKNRNLYGGIWGWVGIHSFNQANYILDKHVTEVVAAQELNLFHTDHGDCSDALTGLFVMEDDIQMTVSLDLLRPDGQKEWGDDWIRIVGSEGSIEANPCTGSLRLIQKGTEERWINDVNEQADPFYTAFLDVILKPNSDFTNETIQGLRLSDTALLANDASFKEQYNVKLDASDWDD